MCLSIAYISCKNVADHASVKPSNGPIIKPPNKLINKISLLNITLLKFPIFILSEVPTLGIDTKVVKASNNPVIINTVSPPEFIK
ncbi:hypothetical protein Wcon_01864 [Wolbachia endosymbiont of Cylisticus convexus]|nr:hypothetical protein Wcon_01864 [Wolbachia endosymbiont of Cylisticus convexus]